MRYLGKPSEQPYTRYIVDELIAIMRFPNGRKDSRVTITLNKETIVFNSSLATGDDMRMSKHVL